MGSDTVESNTVEKVARNISVIAARRVFTRACMLLYMANRNAFEEINSMSRFLHDHFELGGCDAKKILVGDNDLDLVRCEKINQKIRQRLNSEQGQEFLARERLVEFAEAWDGKFLCSRDCWQDNLIPVLQQLAIKGRLVHITERAQLGDYAQLIKQDHQDNGQKRKSRPTAKPKLNGVTGRRSADQIAANIVVSELEQSSDETNNESDSKPVAQPRRTPSVGLTSGQVERSSVADGLQTRNLPKRLSIPPVSSGRNGTQVGDQPGNKSELDSELVSVDHSLTSNVNSTAAKRVAREDYLKAVFQQLEVSKSICFDPLTCIFALHSELGLSLERFEEIRNIGGPLDEGSIAKLKSRFPSLDAMCWR